MTKFMLRFCALLAVCLLIAGPIAADCTYIDRLDLDPILVCTPDPCFDPNGDGVIDPGDWVYLSNYIYSGGPAPIRNGDANADGLVNQADMDYLVNYLYLGGPAPIC